MTLVEWATKYQIPTPALRDLARLSINQAGIPSDTSTSSEAGVSSKLRVEASTAGVPLWRNNVGAYECPRTGRFIRYGLANDSAQLNKKIKSADLIGIKPVTITQEMVGTVIGQFVARETKAPGWVFRDTDKHSMAQRRFLDVVNRMGGDGKFNNDGEWC